MIPVAMLKSTVIGDYKKSTDVQSLLIVNGTFVHSNEKTTKKPKIKDFLDLFPDIQHKWKESIDIVLAKKHMQNHYEILTDLLKQIVDQFPDIRERREVASEFLYLVILGLEHSVTLMKKIGSRSNIEIYVEFLFGVTQYTSSKRLSKDHTLLLISIIKDFFESALPNTESKQKSTEVYKDTLALKKALYEVLTLLFIFAIFEEPSSLSDMKISFILSCIQKVIETKTRILEEHYEINWKEQKLGKIPVSMLSLYMDKKIVKCDLKYVTIKYYYKILKITSNRGKLNYDKRYIFISHLEDKVLSTLDSSVIDELVLALNKSAIIVKSLILFITNRSDKINEELVKRLCEGVKKLTLTSFKVCMHHNMFCNITNKEDVESLSIFHPVDLASLTLKPLLKLPQSSFKNSLISDLILGLNHVRTEKEKWVCNIYLLQLMTLCDSNELYYKKFIEDIELTLNDSLLDLLKNKCFYCSLELYIKEPNLEFSFNEIKDKINKDIDKWLYVLLCLLLGKSISFQEYEVLLNNENANESISVIKNSKRIECFLLTNGMEWLARLCDTYTVIKQFLLILVSFPQITEHWLVNNYLDSIKEPIFLLQFFERAFNNLIYQIPDDENIKKYITKVIKSLRQLTYKDNNDLFFSLIFLLTFIVSKVIAAYNFYSVTIVQ